MQHLSYIFFLLQEKASQSFLFKSDKIFSVLVVLLVIFFGLLAYLILTNRKVNQIEKDIDALKNKVNP